MKPHMVYFALFSFRKPYSHQMKARNARNRQLLGVVLYLHAFLSLLIAFGRPYQHEKTEDSGRRRRRKLDPRYVMSGAIGLTCHIFNDRSIDHLAKAALVRSTIGVRNASSSKVENKPNTRGSEWDRNSIAAKWWWGRRRSVRGRRLGRWVTIHWPSFF